MDELDIIVNNAEAIGLSRTTFHGRKREPATAGETDAAGDTVIDGEPATEPTEGEVAADSQEARTGKTWREIRQPFNSSVMVSLVVNDIDLALSGERKIQPIDITHPRTVFEGQDYDAYEQLPVLIQPAAKSIYIRQDESMRYSSSSVKLPNGFQVPVNEDYDVYAQHRHIVDEVIRGNGVVMTERFEAAKSYSNVTDFSFAVGFGRGRFTERESSRLRVRRRDTSLPASTERRYIAVDAEDRRNDNIILKKFANELCTEPRYNQGVAKTTMKQYGKDFDARAVFRAAYVFQKQRVETNFLSYQRAHYIRDHLRYSKHWDVTRRMVSDILFKEQRVVSVGRLPYTKIELETEDAYPEEEKKRLFPRAKPEKANDKELRKSAALRAQQAYKPRNGEDDSLARPEKVKQNEDTAARLLIDSHPNMKTVARLSITANHKDASQPKKQPSKQAEIMFTEHNLRPEPLKSVSGVEDPEYIDCHSVTDVTDPAYQSVLDKLFPNVVRKEAEYFKEFRESTINDERMILISARHNNQHWTNGLLIDQPPTAAHKALAGAIKQSPRVFILLRAEIEDVHEMMNALVSDLARQVTYDPLTELYTNPRQKVVNSSGIKTLPDRPKFSARAEYTMEDFESYKLRAGVGALIEHNWKEKMGDHTGKAIFAPIHETWNTKHKMHMAYAFTVQVDQSSRNKPALTEGDKIKVVLDCNDNATPKDTWRGKIIPRLGFTGIGEVTGIMQRPMNKESEVLDERTDFAQLTTTQMESMSSSELKYACRHVKRTNIRIECGQQTKEMKLHMEALQLLDVTLRLFDEDQEKWKAMVEHQLLLLCKNHKALRKDGIYDAIHEDYRYDDYILNRLLEHQIPVLRAWIDQGLRDLTAALGGPSGTGKTRTVAEVVNPFLGMIKVPNKDVMRRRRELDAFRIQTATSSEEEKGQPAMEDKNKQSDPEDDPLVPNFANPTSNDSDDFTLERGRITCVAAQNETVDELYILQCELAIAYCEAVGLPKPLVVRKHARATELNAVHAMLHFMFETSKLDDPYHFNPHIKASSSDINIAIREAYLKQYRGSNFRNIRDKRFKNLESSEAARVIELSADDDDQSEEIKACFTDEERDIIRRQLRPLQIAIKRLQNNAGVYNDEIDEMIASAAKIGLDWIEQKANIVVTTASLGLEPRFVVMRRAHVVTIEEFTRLNEGVIWGYFSKYWDVVARVVSGDWRQLGPQLFGPKSDNPFYHQVKLSLLLRLFATGFPVRQLMTTHRFGNEELLNICRIVNKLPDLKMGTTALRPQDTDEVRRIHQQLYRTDSACVLIDVQETTAQADSTGSLYNIGTAIVTMNDLIERVKSYPGSKIKVLSPYNAQTALHQTLCEEAIKMAIGESNHARAQELRQITFSTVDSYMGKEGDTIVLDTLSHPGHIMEVPRAVVAATRGKIGFVIIAHARTFSSTSDAFPPDHVFKKVVRLLAQTKRYFTMSTHFQRRLPQYKDCLRSMGL